MAKRYEFDFSRPGSKATVLSALHRLGLEAEVKKFLADATKEFYRAGYPKQTCERKAWHEMVRLYLPRELQKGFGILKEVVESSTPPVEESPSEPCEVESQEDLLENAVASWLPDGKEESEGESEGEGVAADVSFGLLPGAWPVLPEKAGWQEELEWAYQNGFFVIGEKPGGAVVYRWERARTPPPSQGALVLMKLQAESRQKFMDLLGKSKLGGDGLESESVKREKVRIERIEEMIRELTEGLMEEELVEHKDGQ